jgi:uncharacterized membrane protein YfcA
LIAQVLLIGIAALACGCVNTIAGGGTLLLFPALVATGMSSLSANVTNSMSTWPGYFGGAVGFRHDLNAQWRGLRPLIAAAMAGSIVGCILLLNTPSDVLDALIPVLVLLATLLATFAPRIRRAVARRADGSPRRPLPLIASLFGTGVYSGYFGGATGVVFIAILSLMSSETLHQIVANKTVLSFASATATVPLFGFFGPVQWGYLAEAAPLTLLGGYLGSHAARRISEPTLRYSVAVVGVGASVYLAIRGWW